MNHGFYRPATYFSSSREHVLILSRLTNQIRISSDFNPQALSRVRSHLQAPQSHTHLCSRVMKIIDAACKMTNFWGLADPDRFVRMKEGCRKLDSAIWASMEHMLDLEGWLRPFHYLHAKGVLFTYKCTPHIRLMYYLPSPSLLAPIDFFKRGIFRFGTWWSDVSVTFHLRLLLVYQLCGLTLSLSRFMLAFQPHGCPHGMRNRWPMVTFGAKPLLSRVPRKSAE